MRTIIFLAFSTLLMISCNPKKEKEPQSNIVNTDQKKTADPFLLTDSSWGGITAATDITGLKSLYGDTHIKDERICGPECADSIDVTTVNPGDSLEFVVYWQDSMYHKKISFIKCDMEKAPYHTAGGIRMGTLLSELLRINGKPINFSGFDWDYGGAVLSLNQGALEKSNVHFNLTPTDNLGDNSVSGDAEFNTDMPAVKKILDKVRVGELFLSFNK
jgi:hypothetical protein